MLGSNVQRAREHTAGTCQVVPGFQAYIFGGVHPGSLPMHILAHVSLTFRAVFEICVAEKPNLLALSIGRHESHQRKLVDRSNPAYQCGRNLRNPSSESWWIVQTQSMVARRLGLNNPPASAAGILGCGFSATRLGLNNLPASAGGITGKTDFKNLLSK